jgi:hypothetical protein
MFIINDMKTTSENSPKGNRETESVLQSIDIEKRIHKHVVNSSQYYYIHRQELFDEPFSIRESGESFKTWRQPISNSSENDRTILLFFLRIRNISNQSNI